MKRLVSSVCVLPLFAVASAQPNQCDAVLQYASASTSVNASSLSTRAYSFAKLCRSDGSKKSFGLDVAADIISGSFAGVFDIGGSYDSERHNSFCRENTDLAIVDTSSYSYVQTVSEAAISAWNECVQAANAEVRFTPSYGVGPEDNSTFSIRYNGSAQNFNLTGIHYDTELLNCTIVPPRGVKKLRANEQLSVEIKNRHVNVVCSRNPQNEPSSGGLYYPETSISFTHDAGAVKGQFFREYPLEIPPTHFDRAMQAIAEVQNELNEVGSGEREWLAGQGKSAADTWVNTNCPSGSYVTGISFYHPRGQDYTYQESFRVQCAPFPAAQSDD